jgi:hypothetical protein
VAIGRVGGVLLKGGDGDSTTTGDDATANGLATVDGLTPGKFACTGD